MSISAAALAPRLKADTDLAYESDVEVSRMHERGLAVEKGEEFFFFFFVALKGKGKSTVILFRLQS